MEYDPRFKGGKHHHVRYYQGRRYIIFIGKTTRSMRVYHGQMSHSYHREVFFRNWPVA
jgi:hypothetical protein